MIFKPTIRVIFNIAQTNSSSPYTRTKSRLLTIRSNPKDIIHTALLIWTQNWINTAAATSSAGIVMILLYTWFHPLANERAGSTKYSAWRIIPPLNGTRALQRLILARFRNNGNIAEKCTLVLLLTERHQTLILLREYILIWWASKCCTISPPHKLTMLPVDLL